MRGSSCSGAEGCERRGNGLSGQLCDAGGDAQHAVLVLGVLDCACVSIVTVACGTEKEQKWLWAVFLSLTEHF